MKRASLVDTLVLGALSGMRSSSGLATLAWRRGGVPAAMMVALAAGEMAVDKTPNVPDRVAPTPLAGRMAAGAVAGGVVAGESGDHVLLGGLIGASAAAVATHVAHALRRRLARTSHLGGVVEDLIVVGTAMVMARQRRVGRR